MPPVRTGVPAIDTVLGGLPRGELVAFISCGADLSSAATALLTSVARSDRVVHAVVGADAPAGSGVTGLARGWRAEDLAREVRRVSPALVVVDFTTLAGAVPVGVTRRARVLADVLLAQARVSHAAALALLGEGDVAAAVSGAALVVARVDPSERVDVVLDRRS
jgi:hypothetical protein